MVDSHILSGIQTPADIQSLDAEQCAALATEIRHALKESVSACGGHLASNLGVVELTLALHRIFDFSSDALLWDVGHQAYVHKLLTGRIKDFEQLRQKDGLSGFPDPQESIYDIAKVGHSSTSISSACGIAEGARRAGVHKKTIAVIGDGALTGGMAFEGLINIGELNSDVIVILNDNGNFIDAPVGALHAYLDKIRSCKMYNRIRNRLKRVFVHSRAAERSGVKGFAERLDQALHRLIAPSFIFEDLGFRYFGPVDGHDVQALETTLRSVAGLNRPIIVHVQTRKGAGWEPSLADPLTFHGPKGFDVETGVFHKKAVASASAIALPTATAPENSTYSQIFACTLCAIAAADERCVAITAAMPSGTGLTQFATAYADRMYDVGICEQHSFAFAQGLAVENLRPVLAHYSTFAQRGFDQLFQELVVQRHLGVVLTLDRAGLVGEDGETHQGVYDIAWARCLPGVVLLAPRDGNDLAAMIRWAYRQRDEAAQTSDIAAAYIIRYPKEIAPTCTWGKASSVPSAAIVLGCSCCIQQGDGSLLVMAYGAMMRHVWEAMEQLDDALSQRITLIDPRFAKPIDAAMVRQMAQHTRSITIEDHSVVGGFGSAVLEKSMSLGIHTPIQCWGVEDTLIAHASRAQQMHDQGISASALSARLRDVLETDIS